MIRDITASNVDAARAFLLTYIETSLFLLSSLDTDGQRLGDALNSGNYRCIEEDGKIVSVFALNRRGNLNVQTGGRDDLAQEILGACDRDPIRIEGVLGEWTAASSVWSRLCAEPGFEAFYASKEVLYRLDIGLDPAPQVIHGSVRALAPDDFDHWLALNLAYLSEMTLSPQGTPEQRRSHFILQASHGHWWGAFEDSRLVAIGGLNATYGKVGQVGGVFTVPAARGRGLARKVMDRLRHDAAGRLGLETLILFTDGPNVAARQLYESMGFQSIGYFGLMFGRWGRTMSNHPTPD